MYLQHREGSKVHIRKDEVWPGRQGPVMIFDDIESDIYPKNSRL